MALHRQLVGRVVATTCLLAVLQVCSAVRPVPNPMTDPASCGLEGGRTSWLCDPANMLSRQEARQVEHALAAVRDETKPSSCGKGYQFGVAVVPTLAVYGVRATEDGARRLAKATHDAWGVGFAGCETGLMLVLAVEDRKLYLSTGRETRKLVTDYTVGVMVDNMKPFLRSGDTAGAIVNMANAVRAALNGETVTPDTHFGWAEVIVIMVVLAWLFGMIHGCYKRRRFNRVRSRLERINMLREELERRTRHREEAHPVPPGEADNNAQGGAGDAAVPPAAAAAADPPAAFSGVSMTDGTAYPRNRRHHDNPYAAPGVAAAGANPFMPPPATTTAQDEPFFEADHCPICLEDFPRRVGAGAGGAGAGSVTHRHGVATLACGHQFCTNCAVEWLKTHQKCPVCRKPTQGVAPDAAEEGGTNTFYRRGHRVDRLLLDYELLRLHTMYPDVVSQRQMRQWQQPTYSGAFHEDAQFLVTDPGRQSSSLSGSGGGGSSWGGGISFGGGGGGGSW